LISNSKTSPNEIKQCDLADHKPATMTSILGYKTQN